MLIFLMVAGSALIGYAIGASSSAEFYTSIKKGQLDRIEQKDRPGFYQFIWGALIWIFLIINAFTGHSIISGG